MADQFSEMTSVSWFTRIKDAFASLIFGLILVAVAFPLLFWNEGRAVKTARALSEGAGAVVSVGSDKVDPADEGRLVHVTAAAAAPDALKDDVFGVSAAALRLRRKIEMFQWREKSETRTEKQVGGSEVKHTVYTYDKQWSSSLVNSSSFREPGHANPSALPYPAQEWTASKATLGAFSLPDFLLNKLDAFSPVTPPATPPPGAANLKPAGAYYASGDAANPQVGDVRVSFEAVSPQTVSVIAKQVGSSFAPYATKAGRDLAFIVPGAASAEQMFSDAEKSNAVLTWALRGAGFLAMMIGVAMLFQPLVVVADFLPFLGWIANAGRVLVAFIVAAAFSLATIAVAWIAYRPLLGGALLAVALALIVAGVMRHSSAPSASPAKA
jgi:hypothetical protein